MRVGVILVMADNFNANINSPNGLKSTQALMALLIYHSRYIKTFNMYNCFVLKDLERKYQEFNYFMRASSIMLGNALLNEFFW